MSRTRLKGVGLVGVTIHPLVTADLSDSMFVFFVLFFFNQISGWTDAWSWRDAAKGRKCWFIASCRRCQHDSLLRWSCRLTCFYSCHHFLQVTLKFDFAVFLPYKQFGFFSFLSGSNITSDFSQMPPWRLRRFCKRLSTSIVSFSKINGETFFCRLETPGVIDAVFRAVLHHEFTRLCTLHNCT